MIFHTSSQELEMKKGNFTFVYYLQHLKELIQMVLGMFLDTW